MDAHIAAILARDETVNAVCTRAFERARQEADSADQAPDTAWFAMLIKDNQMTAGIDNTRQPHRRDFVPDTDAGIVARIRAAGGIVLGKTHSRIQYRR